MKGKREFAARSSFCEVQDVYKHQTALGFK